MNPKENFKAVLESAQQDYAFNGATDFAMIFLEFSENYPEMTLKEFREMSDDLRLDETAGLDIRNVKIVKEKSGQGLSMEINGKEYRYVSEDMDTADLFKKFTSQMKYSAGKALAWLKKNSTCYYGSKDAKSTSITDSVEVPEEGERGIKRLKE